MTPTVLKQCLRRVDVGDIYVKMVVNTSQIGWGKYSEFEGPYFKGFIKYQSPDLPTENQKRLTVVCQTEGAAYDAINMYDRCVISVGLIQWCEAQYYLTSRLLGVVCDKVGSQVVLSALKPALDLCSADFRQNSNKQWRFFFKDFRGEVNTLQKQRELFLGFKLDASGKKVVNDGKIGSWDEATKYRALLWASCMANIWINADARKIQDDYTANRLMSFVLKPANTLLWDNTPDDGWNGALRAAFLSFAANNPQKASDHLAIAAKNSKHPKWSAGWCMDIIKQLTFGPQIPIYNERYDKIRPWLEKLWNITLPKTHMELKSYVVPVVDVKTITLPVPTNVEDEPTVDALVTTVTNSRLEKPIVKTSSVEPEQRPATKEVDEIPQFQTGIFHFLIRLIASFFKSKS